MNSIKCIGFIMDGNRRWAKEQGLPSMEGHRKGFETFRNVIEWGREAGIKHAIFYVFSTENWKRDKKEITYLMDLFAEMCEKTIHLAHKHKVQVRVLGQKERLPQNIQKLVLGIERDTKDYTKGTIGLALSYGGRADIVQAVNTLIKKGVTEVDEEVITQNLWTRDIPEPDLIVRTGEVMRLSNFLTWQSAYSELFFSATLWPDFDKEEFDYILETYDDENRRRGA